MSLLIRKWRAEDAGNLARVLNNENVLNNLRDGLPFPYTEEDAAEYIAAMLSADPDEVFAYAIEIDGRAVGSIGAFRQSNIHSRTAELGYYIAEEYWGKGFMSSAVCEFCGKIFAETDIMRIYAEPFAYNIGSRRVLEKAGFSFEGILKNNAVKNGKVLDMAMYALTRSTEPYPVRRLSQNEIPASLELTWEVFSEFEAPEYSEEGIEFFKESLEDEERIKKLKFYGAFDGDELVGTLCMREPQHIGGFFVKAEYHRRGIGKALFNAMKMDYHDKTFTVNSSPYAVRVYEHLGFAATDTEQCVSGLRFTPMVYREKQAQKD